MNCENSHGRRAVRDGGPTPTVGESFRPPVQSPFACGGRRRPARLGAALAAAAVLLCGGCGQGIAWHGLSYDAVHAEAAAAGELTFVYLRSWALVECTRFEEQVLSTPQARQALSGFRRVALEFGWDEDRARQWGVEAPPAIVVVDPAGRVLARATGQITIESLVQTLSDARQRFEQAQSKPATAN